MITLITGLPGNAKTLFALVHIKKRAEAEGREVYYHGINELKLPWTEFEPKNWMDLPDGSIIVIDEAQDHFPKKPNGSTLPDYYTELAKHRHKGFDFYLLTQHPTLIDNFPRKLVQQHFHAIRKFGMQRSTYYEWDKVAEFPERVAAQKNALNTIKFQYPKEAFGWYKSASVHTVKRKIPLKLILAVLLVLVLAGYAAWSFTHMNRAREVTAPVVSKGVGDPASVAGQPGPGAVAAAPFDAVADARHWVDMSTPRLVGLPQTAPKYDELTKPVRVPVPAACIQHGEKCKCFTQQGTPMDVQFNMCLEFARNGFFQEFDADKDRAESAKTARGVQVLEHSPVGNGQLSSSSQVLVLPDVAASKPDPVVARAAGAASTAVR